MNPSTKENSLSEPPENTTTMSGVNLYAEAMEEIKFRTEQARAALKKEISFARPDIRTEFVCLQIRKILELIAFSSLLANKEKYAEAYTDYANHWKAVKILEKISKINPEFYPRPTEIKKEKGVINLNSKKALEDGEDTALTIAEFEKLFDECGIYLHVPEPFKAKPEKILSFAPDQWIKKIVLLLQNHTIYLVDDNRKWFVRMNGDHGRVEVADLGEGTIQSK